MSLLCRLSYPINTYCSVHTTKTQYFINQKRGARVAQLVEHPTSAQVMISTVHEFEPTLGSGLTAQSLDPALDSVSPSLSLCSSPTHALSLSLKNKPTFKKLKIK